VVSSGIHAAIPHFVMRDGAVRRSKGMATARIIDCNNDCYCIDTSYLGVLLPFLSPKASSMGWHSVSDRLLSPVIVTATFVLIDSLERLFLLLRAREEQAADRRRLNPLARQILTVEAIPGK
jgi:hypothetical protein